ncbi:MAG TPA: tetratricopeptide repeat protein [Nitrospirae bacterium]|nr:tetratricopeptide repeat protein [Nitrospirota bacterium]
MAFRSISLRKRFLEVPITKKMGCIIGANRPLKKPWRDFFSALLIKAQMHKYLQSENGKVDSTISDLLKEQLGRYLLKALKLQSLAGISTFTPLATSRVIEKVYGYPVIVSSARSRLRRLADGGYLKQMDEDRYRILQLFHSKDIPYYRRRSTAYHRDADEMMWLSINAADTGSIFEMIGAAIEKGDLKSARTMLEKMIDTGDRITKGKTYHQLAKIEADARKYEKARFYYSQALIKGAGDEFVYADFARFKVKTGDMDGAIKLLKKGAGHHRSSPAIHDLLAIYYSRKKDRYRSEFHRLQALVSESDFVPVKAGVADLLAREDNIEAALKLYRRTARSARRNCYPLYRIGYIYANRLEDKNRARAIFEKIKKIQPDDDTASLNVDLLLKDRLPLPEKVVCAFRKRRLTWNPDRPGEVEVAYFNK